MFKKQSSDRKKAYQKSFKLHGISPKALQWKDKKAQGKRFKELLADIPLEGKSILDVGCGFGDIVTDIMGKTRLFEYTGVDIVPEFIKSARVTYNTRNKNEQKIKVKFLVRDIFIKPFEKKFDVVISSGILNSFVKSKKSLSDNVKETIDYRKKLIKIMWDHAGEIFAFNMAGGFPQPKNKKTNKVYYADSVKILKYCLRLTNKIIFRHHYHNKDFTIVMSK